MKKALICGVTGQDGAYLAKLLLEKGYEVTGSSRDAQTSSFNNLKKLGIYDSVNKISMSIIDFRSVINSIKSCCPDEIYNLSGQSSVSLSFEQPIETFESISTGTLNLLEAIRFMDRSIHFYNAGSSECFGNTDGMAATENTPFRPRSPYGTAKASAFWQVANYRNAYNIHASTGILFNHESPLRPDRFVTQKIITAACRIAKGSNETLTLGNLDIARDWGWAPDYVTAMWKMLQLSYADDFVIATGETHSLREFIEKAFKALSLEWENHVRSDSALLRPSDIKSGYADTKKANEILHWKSKSNLDDIIQRMINDKI